MALDDDVDDLYGLPLDEFTSARNELAKRLRGEGDRAAADEVRSLKKPTAAAWAVNQAVRSRRAEADALLDAGDRLRKVHERLAKGKADAAELREAADEERGAVRSLMEAARGLLGGRKEFLSQAVLDRVEETLHAAAVDDEARAGLESGRLARERKGVGLGAFGAAAPAAPARRAKKAEPERPEAKAGRGKTKAERERAERERERAERAERKQRVGELRRVTRDAESELGRLGKRLEKAERRREQAEAAAAEARGEEKDARERLRALERELRKARQELERLAR